MNKILKLFPVALAVLALSSCSNDDFSVDGKGMPELKSNQMLVTVENLDGDATRAAFVENEIDGTLKRTTIFKANDVIKIYDDSNNWRPQEWTYAGPADAQYTIAKGVAGGDASIFQAPDPEAQYTSGYGIFPAKYGAKKFGEFTNEDRTAMKFDFDMLKVMTATVQENTLLPDESQYKGGVECIAPIPMWGVAASQKMTLKYLTAFLRIDIANVPAAAVNSSKWLLIRSNKALTGEFTATIANPDDDDEGLAAEAPVLVAPTYVANSVDALNAYPKAGASDGNGDILVNLGRSGGDIVVYVPISAGKDATSKIDHQFRVYLSDDVANIGVTTIDFTGKDINSSETSPVAKSVYRGQTYSIIDDSRRVNTLAHTPYDMTKAIVDADDAAKRDFAITFTNPILVKNNDQSTQNYYLDLSFSKYAEDGYSAYDLKHNVTVNVNLEKDASAGTVPAVLYIKTNSATSKQLTLNFTGMTGIQRIEMKDGELKSKLVLNRTDGAKLSAITIGKNQHDLVTVKKGSGTIFAQSNFTITAGQAASDNTDMITLAEGVRQVNIIGGRVSAINMDATKKIDDNVTINTEGKVGINEVDYANMVTEGTGAATKDKFNIIYTSKYTGDKSTIFATATVNGRANTIITASQLAAAVAGTAYNVVGTFDLNGSENAWTPLTLTKSVLGAQYIRKDANTVALKDYAVIENLKGANGLIGSWTPTTTSEQSDVISNIELKNGTVEGTTANLGLLAGTVNMATTSVLAATIKDVKLTGTNKVSGATKANTYQGIGGVIGKTTGTVAALQLSNVKVNDATTVEGFKNVGGIIGDASGKVVFGVRYTAADGAITDKFASSDTYNSADVQANVSNAKLETYKIATTTPCTPNLATKGQFFGGATLAADGDVAIMGQLTKLENARTATEWGYYIATADEEYFPWYIKLYYEEIGLYGTKAGENAVTEVTTPHYVKMYTQNSSGKYGTQTLLKPYINKATSFSTAPQSLGATMYFGFVEKPAGL